MYSLPYFPFRDDDYRVSMDTFALREDRLIEIDGHYAEEIALKEAILAQDHAYYCHAPASTNALQWEAVELLLENLARTSPEHFALHTEGNHCHWDNRLLSLHAEFEPGNPSSLPLPPLDWIARQVQEDLLLMEETPDGKIVLAAGHLCFGASWCLGDKVGLSFLDIHAPVPQFRMGLARPADLLMKRLKPGLSASRINWSIATTDRLNLSPATFPDWASTRQGITPENAGERCFLRLERQTLTRLPQTRGILFTIHTYRAPLRELEEEPEKFRCLTRVLRSLPEEVAVYKGMSGYRAALLSYLDLHNADGLRSSWNTGLRHTETPEKPG